jgi:hypothetical protein
MATIAEIVEGWTERISFTLKSDGTAINGTGLTLTDVIITARDGTVVETTGDFGWLVQASGTIFYDPDSTDFTAGKSPYRVRAKVTDGSGKVVFFPNASADTIVVRGPRS